jgi:hypothetical protein
MESPRESGGFLFYALAVSIKIRKLMVDRSALVLLPEALEARSLFVESLPEARSLAQLEPEIFVIYLLPNFSRFDLTFGKYALRLLHKPNGKTKGK